MTNAFSILFYKTLLLYSALDMKQKYTKWIAKMFYEIYWWDVEKLI